MTNRHRCMEDGCDANAIECVIPGGSQHEDVPEWFCPTHAVKAGYCGGCGAFIAGSDERFDCGVSPFCEHCREADDDEEDTDGD